MKKDAALVSKPDGRGSLPLNLAADRPIAEALLAAGAEVDAVAGTQRTALADAIDDDRGDVLGLLLAKGAKVYDPGSLLRDCAKRGKAKAAEALIESGVPVDAAEPATQATPLLLAVVNDRVTVAELLLAKGADPNAQLASGSLVASMGGAASNFATSTADAGGAASLKLAKSDAMRELLKKKGAR